MATGEKALHWAVPILARNKIRLALENHKDQTIEERIKILNTLSSEHIQACLDVGNNIALLEDPVEVAKALAPWTITVHFKDQAVQEYQDGFLLADTPLGTGCIDLVHIVRLLREKSPKAHLNLELITRDALPVPILLPSYWQTFPQVTAQQLAGSIAFIKKHSTKETFPKVTQLPLERQTNLEEMNIHRSLRFATEQLKLKP
jgi:sugar phosphate isomerase/epimerase